MFTSDLPRWPRYRPLRIIGQGGFGTVYLCEDTEPTSAVYKQQVAVKAISLTALSDEEALMVMSEVSLLKSIDHPNIIKYYDSFLYEDKGERDVDAAGKGEASEVSRSPWSHNGCVKGEAAAQWLCLVTEYMDGGDLSSLLKHYTKFEGPQSDTNEEGVKQESERAKLRLSSPPSHLLEESFTAAIFQWNSSGSDTDAAEVSLRPFTQTTMARQHKRGRATDVDKSWNKAHKKEKAAGNRESGGRVTEGEVGKDTWVQLSSQHRRRLASTLRLAEHPSSFTQQRNHSAADDPSSPFTLCAAAQTSIMVDDSSDDAAAGKAALETWMSDTAVAVIPPTPLGATEVKGLAQVDEADLLQTSFSTIPITGKMAAAVDAPGGTASSISQLEAQLPSDPNQLWVESFLITDIAKQCLDALAYLHALGVIHRDIKPSNIYLSKRDGTVKLGDFGVSKLLQPSAPFATTFVGTPFYLCPELCMGDPYSYGADIWALGVLLYELYCLKLPFLADNVLGQIYVITEGTYDKEALRCPHAFAAPQRTVLEDLYGPSFAQSEVLLHGLVVEMVEQMLSVDPAKRPSAEALLAGVFGGGYLASRAGSSAGPSVLPTPVRRPPSAGLLPPFDAKHNAPDGEAKNNCNSSGSAGGGAVSPSNDRRSRRDGGGATTAGAIQAGRLGSLAAVQHARWASALVQAPSAAHNLSTTTGCWEGGSPGIEPMFTTISTPAPPSRLWSSPQPASRENNTNSNNTALGEEKELLAMKVKLNMRDLLQEMGDEQRERLELCAAEEDAYDSQRLKNVAATVVSSPSAAARTATATATACVVTGTATTATINPAVSEQKELPAYGSFADYTITESSLLPPMLRPTHQLYSSEDVNDKQQSEQHQLLPTNNGTTDLMKRANSLLRSDGDAAATAVVASVLPAFASLSKEDAEDSLDRLIDTDVREELNALLDEVPWLQNADVFSAIPLSAGSDDVMFVARAGHRRSSTNSVSASEARKTHEKKREARAFGSGALGGSTQSTNVPQNMQQQHSEPQQCFESQHAGEGGTHLSEPAVYYAGSVSRSNPNIEVAAMPQSSLQRQRTSIVSILHVSQVVQEGQQELHAPQRLADTSKAEEAYEQRRVSAASSRSSAPSTPFCAGAIASAGHGGKGKNKVVTRRGQVPVTAAVAAIGALPLGVSATDRRLPNSSNNDSCSSNPPNNEVNSCSARGEGEEKRTALVTVAASPGDINDGGVRRFRPSSSMLHGDDGVATIRIRPLSTTHRDGGAHTKATSAGDHSNSNTSSSFVQEQTKRAHRPAEVDAGVSLDDFHKREGHQAFPAAPLPTAGLHTFTSPEKQPQPQHQQPSIPKVLTAGRCEGFTTGELERLLRAKLLAHYKKRQQELRAQRTELAAQEAARAKIRQKLEVLFMSAYNAGAGSASPKTVCETASYYSNHTDDSVLSADEGAAAFEGLYPLTRTSNLPHVPGTSLGSSSPAQASTPPVVLRQPTSARRPSPKATTAMVGAAKMHSSPIMRCGLNASSLDNTARQAVKEEAVLRALSARYTTENMTDLLSEAYMSVGEKTNSSTTHSASTSTSAGKAAPDASKLPLCTTNNMNISSRSKDPVQPDLLMDTPAVRQLRQTATFAAAVARQREVFRKSNAPPARIQITPAWRPPHDSKDVPGLWETSSAEEEAEPDARGQPGRPAPVNIREELRWRWSAPPTDTGSEDDEEDMTATSSDWSTSSSVSSPGLFSSDGARGDGKRLRVQTHKTLLQTPNRKDGATATRSHNDTSTEDDADDEQGDEGEEAYDTELQRQLSLFASPIELHANDHVAHDFPPQRSPTHKPQNTPSSLSEQGSRYFSHTGSEGNADSRSSSSHSSAVNCSRSNIGQDSSSSSSTNTNTNSASRRSSSGGVEAKRQQHSSRKQQRQRRAKYKAVTKSKQQKMNNSSSTVASSEPTSSTSHSSASNSSNSSSDENDDSNEESDEDMSYAYTVQIDAETGCRFFDYVCPITVELVGELPAACRVATVAQIKSELFSPSPSETKLMSTYTSSGLGDLALTAYTSVSPSPPPPREMAAAAPSPKVEEEEEQHPLEPYSASAVFVKTNKVNSTAEDDDNSNLESSGKSALFVDCSLLLPNSPPSPPPSNTQNAKVESITAAANAEDNHSKKVGHTCTASQISPPYTGDAARGVQKAKGEEGEVTKNEDNDSPSSYRRTESMCIVGKKVPVPSPTPLAPSAPQRAATFSETTKTKTTALMKNGMQEETKDNRAPRKHRRELSAMQHRTTGDNATPNGMSNHHLVWRVRVPPLSSPTPTSGNSTPTATAAAIASVVTTSGQYVTLPLSLALRPIRVRTRFVGLLWRLWWATQLADPALRRVLFGSQRCSGPHSTCTFAEAFGDWVKKGYGKEKKDVDSSTVTTLLAATTDATLTTSAEALISTGEPISMATPTLRMSAPQNSNGPLELSSVHKTASMDKAEVTKAQDAAVAVPPSPGRRWTLYYVEPRFAAVTRLQTDDDWAVVRHKVREMGQLLPFIRLYLVLHEAECASSI